MEHDLETNSEKSSEEVETEAEDDINNGNIDLNLIVFLGNLFKLPQKAIFRKKC